MNEWMNEWMNKINKGTNKICTYKQQATINQKQKIWLSKFFCLHP